MSNEQLIALKEQLSSLTPQEKLELAKFLTEEAKSNPNSGTGAAGGTDSEAALKRLQHMEWLKANREEYAGRYVALEGDRLVGCGATIREANEQARRAGFAHAFLVHVSSMNEAPFGGW